MNIILESKLTVRYSTSRLWRKRYSTGRLWQQLMDTLLLSDDAVHRAYTDRKYQVLQKSANMRALQTFGVLHNCKSLICAEN